MPCNYTSPRPGNLLQSLLPPPSCTHIPTRSLHTYLNNTAGCSVPTCLPPTPHIQHAPPPPLPSPSLPVTPSLRMLSPADMGNSAPDFLPYLPTSRALPSVPPVLARNAISRSSSAREGSCHAHAARAGRPGTAGIPPTPASWARKQPLPVPLQHDGSPRRGKQL